MMVILLVNLLFTGLFLWVAYSPYIQPVSHPALACLGLTFPIFLFIEVAFLLFWLLIQQYKAALIALLGLLLGYGPIRTYLPIRMSSDEVPEGSFKLLSYNIMGFDGCKRVKGGNPVLDYLLESQADILCLQEYVTMNHPYLSQGDVDKVLSPHYPYPRICSVCDRPGFGNQIALYSKFPILSGRSVLSKGSANGFAVFELVVQGDTLTLIGCHLESNKLTAEDKAVYTDMLKDPEKEKVKSGLRLLVSKLAEATALRAPQADAVAAEVAAARHRPLIVWGDFNDSPISYTHRTISQGLKDAFVESGSGFGISYNQNHFYFRIDNILASPELKSYRCEVDRHIDASDHYPIACWLKREPQPE